MTTTPTLIQLLDRLAELRPDICATCLPWDLENRDHRCYQIHAQGDCHYFEDVDLWERFSNHYQADAENRLKGAIERAIEVEMQNPDKLWFGYGSGCNHEVGEWGCIITNRHIERLHQPSQVIALLSCFVEAIEGGVA